MHAIRQQALELTGLRRRVGGLSPPNRAAQAADASKGEDLITAVTDADVFLLFSAWRP